MAKIHSYNKKSHKEELSEAPQVEELLKNLEFHKAIQSLTQRIMQAPSIREILLDLKEDIRELFNIHILTIYLIDKAKKEIFTLNEDGSEYRFPMDNRSLAGFVAQKKKMVHIADAYNEREIRRIHDSLIIDRFMDKKTGILTGQVIASPIMRDNLILGVMEIMNKKGGDKIDDYNQIFLDEITGVLARAFYIHLNFAEAKELYGSKFEFLIRKGIIGEDQMDNAIKEMSETREDLAEILMARYHISKKQIGDALAAYYACQFIPYNPDLPIPRDLLIGIEKYTLLNMMWVPLKVVKGKIYVAIDNPQDQSRKNKIEEILETGSIQYDVSIRSDILQYINRYYYSGDESAAAPVPFKPAIVSVSFEPEEISMEPVAQDEPNVRETEIPVPEPSVTLEPAEEFADEEIPAPVLKISQAYPPVDEKPKPAATSEKLSSAPIEKEQFPDIDDLAEIKSHAAAKPAPPMHMEAQQTPQPLTDIINNAWSRKASDIHFEPDAKSGQVALRVRINGQFLALQTLTFAEYDIVTRQIKTQAGLDVKNRTAMQNGNFSLSRPSGDDIHMRVSFIPTRSGPADAVVHISTRLRKMPLELLGLSEKNYTDLVNILRQPRGLVLITGPADSGMTTTLHACLDNIISTDIKIWTAEEPIEIVQDGLRQVQIDPRKGFDFPSVLTSFLTADPDVIMASRINERATANLCMQAAIKGCLVLGSLWAESIPDTIERCLDMETGHLMFADAMLAIMQQRLIKTLCPKCKEKYHPSHEEYEELSQIYGKDAFEKLNIPYSNAFSLFRPKGCPSCSHTGYTGRMCVSETLIFTPQIKRMIRRKESPQFIYQAALESGMTTLMQDGISKVLQGLSDNRHVRLACVK